MDSVLRGRRTLWLYAASAVFGALLGAHCTSSLYGLGLLFILSICFAALLAIGTSCWQNRFKAGVLYCAGLTAYSGKFAELWAMVANGMYTTALAELPELFFGVLMVLVLGLCIVMLARAVWGES